MNCELTRNIIQTYFRKSICFSAEYKTANPSIPMDLPSGIHISRMHKGKGTFIPVKEVMLSKQGRAFDSARQTHLLSGR